MTKFLTVLAAGSALALVSVAAPTTAEARWRGGGVAAGVIGGIAAGAIIAGAASAPYYGPGYAYGPGYGYGPYAYDGPTYYGSDNGYGYRGYGYRGWGGATSDYTHADRDLVGTR